MPDAIGTKNWWQNLASNLWRQFLERVYEALRMLKLTQLDTTLKLRPLRSLADGDFEALQELQGSNAPQCLSDLLSHHSWTICSIITLILNTSVLHIQVLYEVDSIFYPPWDGKNSPPPRKSHRKTEKLCKINRKIVLNLTKFSTNLLARCTVVVYVRKK